jgi:antitoxin HicB
MVTVMKNLNYYLNLVYPVTLYEEEDGITAVIQELPGCLSFGATCEEALQGVKEVKRLWIEGKLKAKQPIPEPSSAEQYSGKFVLRIPKQLHETLSREAVQEGCSLNAYLTYLLADRNQQRSLQRTLEQFKETQKGPRTIWVTASSGGHVAPAVPFTDSTFTDLEELPESMSFKCFNTHKGAQA